MSKKKPKIGRQLKIKVSFEVSRIADECLESAYEQVMPELRRATGKDNKGAKELLEVNPERAEASSQGEAWDGRQEVIL